MKKVVQLAALVIIINTNAIRTMEETIKVKTEPTIIIIDTNNGDNEIVIPRNLATQFLFFKNALKEPDEDEIKIPIDNQGADIKLFFEFVKKWVNSPYDVTVEQADLVPYMSLTNQLGDAIHPNEKFSLLVWLVEKMQKSCKTLYKLKMVGINY